MHVNQLTNQIHQTKLTFCIKMHLIKVNP
jgi:hypothetical protein